MKQEFKKIIKTTLVTTVLLFSLVCIVDYYQSKHKTIKQENTTNSANITSTTTNNTKSSDNTEKVNPLTKEVDEIIDAKSGEELLKKFPEVKNYTEETAVVDKNNKKIKVYIPYFKDFYTDDRIVNISKDYGETFKQLLLVKYESGYDTVKLAKLYKSLLYELPLCMYDSKGNLITTLYSSGAITPYDTKVAYIAVFSFPSSFDLKEVPKGVYRFKTKHKKVKLDFEYEVK